MDRFRRRKVTAIIRLGGVMTRNTCYGDISQRIAHDDRGT